jgi:hypothetical protein
LVWVFVVVVVTGLGVVVSCVVVVVTGLGVVVSCVVVVELRVASAFLSLFIVVQADSDTRAAAARHGMISFFINTLVVWMVTLHYKITPSVGHILWGVTRPDTRR